MNFQPMQYGNVKGYFHTGKYVIAKTKFGWCAWFNYGTDSQKLLTTEASANTKAGAIADCEVHEREARIQANAARAK